MSAWTHVDEAMPDSDTDVIVATKDGHVQGGFYDGNFWRWVNTLLIEIDVTHWMPFPSPPQAQTKKEASK